MVPMLMQAFIMLSVSVNRIRDYLVLPELKGNEQDCDNNSEVESGLPENVVIRVSNGKFKWGPPPEIPMSANEIQKIQSEKKKREAEAREKEKQQIQKNSSQSVFNKGNSNNRSSSNNSEADNSSGILKVTVKQPSPSSSGEDDQENSDLNITKSINITPSSASSLSPFPFTSPSSDKNRPTLNNINVEILKGGLTMVIGFQIYFLFFIL
jgi:hypothetical protein